MNKKLVVLQQDKNDCAAASLLSIIKYYGGYLSLETIKEKINTTKTGTNAYDLIKGSKEIGFDAYGKKVSFADIEMYKNLFPVIAHVKKHHTYHFVVLYEINAKKHSLKIMDPSIGLYSINYSDFENIYENTLLFFTKVKELPKIKKENKLLKIIIKVLIKNKKTLVIISILSLLVFILSFVDAIYFKIIINSQIFDAITTLFIIILILLRNISKLIRNKLSIKTNYKLSTEINKETLTNIFSLPYNYYKNKSTGEIISRINDLDSLKELLSNFLLNTFVDTLLIIISFIIMFMINKPLTIVSITIVVMYYLIVKLFRNKYKIKIGTLQETKGYYNETLTETLNNIESVTNLNLKSSKIKELNNIYKSLEKQNKNINFTFTIEQFIKNTIYEIGIIILLSIGSIMVSNKQMSLDDLIIIFMIITNFIGVIKSLLDKDLEISYTLKNIERVNSLFLDNNEIKLKPHKIKGDIILKNVGYSYGSSNALKNINLVIKDKDKILFTGKSGIGKSTLIKIILKYLSNYTGDIYIRNKSLHTLDNQTINNSFVYISQNEGLFSKTFKDNIILNRNITDVDYEKIIKICELKEVRNKRAFTDDFIIEENGFNLSGGERQRIVLARGLLKDANYIIIDEALSEVSLDLEKKIIKNIFNNFKDKTIIYITHKEEIKELFKKIYNLERRQYDRI